MTTKIDLAEKQKILAFKKEIKEQLSAYKDNRIVVERNEFFNNLIAGKAINEDTDYEEDEDEDTENNYDDDSEVIDFEVPADVEAEIMKEFGKEMES